MSEIWLTSDTHFGEDRFEAMCRPFKSVEGHNNTILNRFNELVKPEDEVIVVGDVVYRPEFLPLVKQLNGKKKTLIKGNHDAKCSDADFSKYFDTIIADGGGLEMEVEGLPIYLTHYPSQSVEDRFNCVAHIHSAWKFQLNMLNIGIDVHHFRPVNLKQVPYFYNAICKHYDEDVWAAYMPTNGQHVNKRGKKGTYFPKAV